MGSLCFDMGLGPKLDLDAAAAENRAFMMTRTSERQEMVALNDRLAAYIEKAREPSTLRHPPAHVSLLKSSQFWDFFHPDPFELFYQLKNQVGLCVLYFFLQVRTLESKNKLLEAEIEALKRRHARPSGLRQLYESQLKDLNRVAEQMRVQRVREVKSYDQN